MTSRDRRQVPPRPPAAVPRNIVMVDDQHDELATRALLRDIDNLDAGVMVIRPAPSTTTLGGLTLATLAALGKPVDVRSAGRPPWRLAQAWTAGHQPDAIVLDRAHTPPAKVLAATLALAAETTATLWLIDAGHGPRRRCSDRLPRRAQYTTAPPQQLATLRRASPAEPDPPAIPDLLPTADFLTFRAVCARRLNPATATAVDAVYRETFTDFLSLGLGARSSDSDQRVVAWNLPHDLTVNLARHFYTSASAGEALVRLRAAQAALLRAGFLLHHVAGLHELSPASHLLCPLTSHVAATLHAELSTSRAAAAALHLLTPDDWQYRTTPRTIAGIAGDASFLGHHRHSGIPVPAPARPILRAHLTWRRQDGAAGNDPLFEEDHLDELALPVLAELPIPPGLKRSYHYPDAAEASGSASVWMRQRHLYVDTVTPYVPGAVRTPWLQGATR